MGNNGESRPKAQEGYLQIDVARVTKPVVRIPSEESMIDGERRKRHHLQYVLTTSMEQISKTAIMTAAYSMHRSHVSFCSIYRTVTTMHNKSNKIGG